MSTPKLRFPEFAHAGEWEEKMIKDICVINPQTETLPSSFIYIDLESVEQGQLLIKKRISKQDAPSRAQRYLHKDDVLIQLVRPYQRNNLYFDFIDDEYVASTGYAQLRTTESSKFLFQLIHEDSFVKQILSKCTGSSYPAINSSDVANLYLSCPSLPEQQKIADCLSSLDDLIAAHKQKLDSLKTHKKGLMQNLFPAKGETVPRLRFPEFENAGEWAYISLGKVAEVKRGAASQYLNYLEKSEQTIRLLRINDFLSNDPVYVEDTEEMKKYRVMENDLLIAGTGATAGITFIVPKEFSGFAYSYNAPRIRISFGVIMYIYYYLKSDLIRTQQKKAFVGNAQPFLDTDAIRNLQICHPSLPEQQKIADCLSSLDEMISAEAQKIEALKVHKKALMQQLFPQGES